MKNFFIIPIFLLFLTNSFAQDFSFGSLGDSNEVNTTEESLIVVKIMRISPNRKFFVLTNQGDYGAGDFVTLLVQRDRVLRAVVAKDYDGYSGIKVLRGIDEKLEKSLREGQEVNILRGDDSYFKKEKEKVNTDKEEQKELEGIMSEDDLYLFEKEEDGEVDGNNKRAIKQDNILTLRYGGINSVSSEGESGIRYQFSAGWAYQFTDNIWIEGLLGRSQVKNFPAYGQDTELTSFFAQIKYCFEAPFYSFILPYIGVNVISVDAPGAGVEDGVSSTEELTRQTRVASLAEKQQVSFGVTVLKRVVPGWFARVDIGLDFFGGGLSLEF